MQTLEVAHVLNHLVSFLVGYRLLFYDIVPEYALLAIVAGFTGIGYLTNLFLVFRTVSLDALINDMKSCAFLSGSVLFLSPVLRSMTETYSNDTIALLVTILLLIHLIWYDYSLVRRPIRPEERTLYMGSPISLNAIFFAAIVLSSRLKSELSVFCVLYASIIVFGYSPLLR